MNWMKDAAASEAAIAAKAAEIGRQHQHAKAIKKARAELRDRFAMAALTGLLAYPEEGGRHKGTARSPMNTPTPC